MSKARHSVPDEKGEREIFFMNRQEIRRAEHDESLIRFLSERVRLAHSAMFRKLQFQVRTTGLPHHCFLAKKNKGGWEIKLHQMPPGIRARFEEAEGKEWEVWLSLKAAVATPPDQARKRNQAQVPPTSICPNGQGRRAQSWGIGPATARGSKSSGSLELSQGRCWTSHRCADPERGGDTSDVPARCLLAC